ncbi:Uncharacterised protein g754 [Pycnogonum litorale]
MEEIKNFRLKDEQIDSCRIREKLKETCNNGSRLRTHTSKEKYKKGPVVGKHCSALSSLSPKQVKKQIKTAEDYHIPSYNDKSIDNYNQDIVCRQGGILSVQNKSSLVNNRYGYRQRSPSLPRSHRHTSPSNRSHQRRRTPSPANLFDPQQIEIIQKRILKISKVKFYLLRQPGPNSFLVASESPDHKYKVIIGPQICTCGKGPHCLHLLFVMLRVLQIKETDSYLWNKTLKNYEVEALFHEYHLRRDSKVKNVRRNVENMSQRTDEFSVDSGCDSSNANDPLTTHDEEESLCPICLLEMSDKERLVVCIDGCKNKLHHQCLSIWAEECRRQSEPVICPLCRTEWTCFFDKHCGFTFKSSQNSSPGLSANESSCLYISKNCSHNDTASSSSIIANHCIPLSNACNVPEVLPETAQQWITVFGFELVSCFYSRDWAVREAAIRRLTREIITKLLCDGEQDSRIGLRGKSSDQVTSIIVDKETMLSCCSDILSHISMDPVYKVYTACLRCLRGLLAYSSCRTERDVTLLQSIVRPIIFTILPRCADSNRRTSQLSIATLLEMCRGQSGALAVGNLTRHPARTGLGGINFVLSCALESIMLQEATTSLQWLLGRLCFVNRTIEEFPHEFLLRCISVASCKCGSKNKPETKLLNIERLMSVLRFGLESVNNLDSAVSKAARRLFINAAQKCVSVPAVLARVHEMISVLDSSLETFLKRRIASFIHDSVKNPETGKHYLNNSSSVKNLMCAEHELIQDDVMTDLENNKGRCRRPRMLRSNSHSPGRKSNASPLSPLRSIQNQIASANHLPRIRNDGSTTQKYIKRPNNLPLLNKISVLLPNKSSIHKDLASDCQNLSRVSKANMHFPTSSGDNDIMDQFNNPRNENEDVICHIGCPTSDLGDLMPSANDWSSSFKTEVHSPNTPSVAPYYESSAKFPELAAYEEEVDESVTLVMTINARETGNTVPVIPGLNIKSNKESDAKVCIKPEIFSNAYEKTNEVYREDLHWVKGPLLGAGAFSTCYQARDVQSGTLMAVKQASFCRNTDEEQEKVMATIKEEIIMMAKLDHLNIVRILGATQQAEHFNMFFEWMSGGSIASLLDKYGPFTEPVVINYTKQVLEGLTYLHNNQILHRDLKGANLLVDSTGRHLRIGDFGAAAKLASQSTVTGEFQGQLLGTIAFMAPEVLRGENYGRSCDVWSVGCVIIEMCTGKPPWNATDISNHLALIFKIACSAKPPPVPEHVSCILKDLSESCLMLKSEERPTAKDLLQHDCFIADTPG